MQALNSDARSLIPHQARMSLIDRVQGWDKEKGSGRVSLQLRSDAPYFFEDRFQTHWLIEICAQASAAVSHLCLRREDDGAPPPGYLVSIRDFRFDEDVVLKLGDELVVDVMFEGAMDPIGQSRCEVRCGAQSIASGEMTFYSQEA